MSAVSHVVLCDAGAVALATSPLVREDRLVMENRQTIIMALLQDKVATDQLLPLTGR